VHIPILALSGGRPWLIMLIGAIGFIIILLLIIFVMYPRRRG
jgi:hypothetical protein